MRSPTVQGGRGEKAQAGFFGGVNSARTPLLLSDTQVKWAVNSTNRGGVYQTRYGYKMVLALPEGNLQGLTSFTVDKNSTFQQYLVFAVDGKVYAAPFPLIQPLSWDVYQLKNISFDKNQKNVYWETTKKGVSETSSGTLKVIEKYSVLMMQDGKSPAAYWDGFDNGQLNEDDLQTPIGTWMKWSGNRLWIARGNVLLAGDIFDPLSFKERVTGAGAGDFPFDEPITALANALGDNRQANLVVFSANNGSILLSSIQTREDWFKTPNFKSLIYPSVGCIAGRSVVNHAGFLWWYSDRGLIASDSAASAYLSSQIKVRDVEMAQSKREFSDDISGICSASFESFLLVSVPSGDTYNADTMVLDYSISDELNQELPPAWAGVWTGIRPVEWASQIFGGQKKLYAASKDYFPVLGTTNHIWETFQPERFDSYLNIDSDGVLRSIPRPIYCSVESKLLGDGMDLKTFAFAEVDLVEIGGEVNLRISFAGDKGAYREIYRRKIIATLDAEATGRDEIVALQERIGDFKTQSRRESTGRPSVDCSMSSVESFYDTTISKAFSLYFQWCGRMGIESFRFFTEIKDENLNGRCLPDETGFNVVSQNGDSYRFT